MTVIQSRIIRWVENVERMGTERNAYRFLVGKPKGQSSIGEEKCT